MMGGGAGGAAHPGALPFAAAALAAAQRGHGGGVGFTLRLDPHGGGWVRESTAADGAACNSGAAGGGGVLCGSLQAVLSSSASSSSSHQRRAMAVDGGLVRPETLRLAREAASAMCGYGSGGASGADGAAAYVAGGRGEEGSGELFALFRRQGPVQGPVNPEALAWEKAERKRCVAGAAHPYVCV